jgi:hypothetical protein
VLPEQTSGLFIFSFESINGKTYYFEGAETVDGTGWQTEGSVQGDGTMKFVTNSISSGNKYYRLRVE